MKRIHLADCALSSPQAIALAEIIPEIRELAHINLLENPELKELTEAKTEEKQEEACALFASLLAAARISTSLVAVDIEVPSEQCGELVKAMAKQVIAYCLRNMERLSVSEPAAATTAQIQVPLEATAYPDVLQHLVGKDGAAPDSDAEYDAAPNDDYVIGGTGVVKALACCLENRGVESRRQSIDFIRDVENGVMQPKSRMPSGKAKETSKHLLSSARKIRHRLQPVLQKARAAPGEDPQAYHRLLFLNSTLEGIIKRFEDEFPDTREGLNSAGGALSSDSGSEQHLGTSVSSAEVESELFPASLSDAEDEENGGRLDLGIRPAGAPASASLARSDSSLSMTSRKLTHEEGEVFRAGQHFRAGILRPEHYMLLSRGLEMVKSSPQHVRMLHELLDELGDEGLLREARQKSIDSVFREHRDEIIEKMRAADPAHWDRFTESQVMASANTRADNDEIKGAVAPPSRPPPLPPKMVGPGEEGAVVDE